jgi:hypothetical protein
MKTDPPSDVVAAFAWALAAAIFPFESVQKAVASGMPGPPLPGSVQLPGPVVALAPVWNEVVDGLT